MWRQLGQEGTLSYPPSVLIRPPGVHRSMARERGGQFALLSLQIQMLISPRNALTATPRIISDQVQAAQAQSS